RVGAAELPGGEPVRRPFLDLRETRRAAFVEDAPAARPIDAARGEQHAVADRADRAPRREERGDALLQQGRAEVLAHARRVTAREQQRVAVRDVDGVPRDRIAEGVVALELAV